MALGLNDVDLDGMKEMDRKVRENPALGKRTAKLRSTWQRGAKALVEIGTQEILGKVATPPTRRFFVTMDAPAGLGGVDAAPTAAETLLAALAGCITSGIAANAALFNVPIDALSVDLEADIDFRGVLGHDKSVRNGFTDIRYTVTVQSPASEEQVRRCKETIDRKSPVADTLAEPGEDHVDVRAQAELSGGRDAGRGQLHLHEGADPLRGEGGRAGRGRDDLPRGGAVARLPDGRPQLDSRRGGQRDGDGLPGLMHEPDEDRWARRYGESFMDWKPREERSYLGTYSMGIGSPRAAYQRVATIYAAAEPAAYGSTSSRSAAAAPAIAGRPSPGGPFRSGAARGARSSSSASRPTGDCRAPASSRARARRAVTTPAAGTSAGGTRRGECASGRRA